MNPTWYVCLDCGICATERSPTTASRCIHRMVTFTKGSEAHLVSQRIEEMGSVIGQLSAELAKHGVVVELQPTVRT